MPLRVVPILPSPRPASVAASIIWCHGMISCARLETTTREQSTPRDSSASISENRVGMSTTTPFPITGVTAG